MNKLNKRKIFNYNAGILP